MTLNERESVENSAMGAPPPSSVRLSKQTREQIATLKRRTGIRHMNAICRWALCRSLLEPTPPPRQAAETAAEIEWSVFAGVAGQLWWNLCLEDAWAEGLSPSPSEAEAMFRAHIARGVSYLVGDPSIKDVTSLARLALSVTA